MKIIKQELEFEECIKQRLEFICEISKVITTFVIRIRRIFEKYIIVNILHFLKS